VFVFGEEERPSPLRATGERTARPALLDLLVSGSRGYGLLRAVLLGGVSRRLAAEAQCPVIVLPRGVETALEALTADAPGATAAG
jgi:hypothetical protein